MSLGFITFLRAQLKGSVKKNLLFFLLLPVCSVFAQHVPPKELKKDADKLFEAEAYSQAYKLYAQLVANFPKDPEYNFRLGVCMIYSEPDKKKCIPFLKQAAANQEEAPKETFFYLGKAYHINYLFDEAIKNYLRFKEKAPAAAQKKLQVDREIQACRNGMQLLSNMSDLIVQAKKELNEADYFRSYDLKDMGGKLLVKPEDFKTSADKKKKENSVVFLPKGSGVVFFSSYGEDGATGKDIYSCSRLPNGTFSKPNKVDVINTQYDEDYPFLHPNGNTLYFASKGHNSMGGYDIFKSSFNEETGSWEQPVNLEFPINSPDDDFLFVTDSLEQTAYFSTGRQSPPGKIDVLRIKTERPPMDMLVVKGKVTGAEQEKVAGSVITIKNRKNEMPLGTVEADENGEYTLEVPNGGNLLYTVESPGFKTQSRKTDLPFAATARLIKQTIAYEKGILNIYNDAEPPKSDSAYKDYLAIIEKKAKLNVNEGDRKVSPKVISEETESPVTVKNDEAVANTTVSGTAGKPTPKAAPMDNKQLAGMAKQDAEQSRKDAAKLKQEARDALENGNRQKAEADKMLAEAAQAITAAESISDPVERKKAIEEASSRKQSAKTGQAIAIGMIAKANGLEDDARLKEREANLNEQYARELESVSTGKGDKNSIKRLEELLDEISSISQQSKETEEKLNAANAATEEKEKEIAAAEQESTELKTSIAEIQTHITEKEKAIASTRKKSARRELETDIVQLNEEKTAKEKALEAQAAKVSALQEELLALNTEAAGIKQSEGTVPSPVATTESTAAGVASATVPGKEADKEAVTTITKPLENTEGGTPEGGTPEGGGGLPAKQEGAAAAATTVALAPEQKKAIARLDSISSKLSVNETAGVVLESYGDPDADKIKEEALAEIRAITEQQNRLQQTIDGSKENIARSAPAATVPNAEALSAEAEALSVQAQQTRRRANDAQGSERDKLKADATALETRANEKLTEAAAATAVNNRSTYDAGLRNYNALTSRNKAPAKQSAEATRLADDAALAFRQAEDIRKEAEAMSNTGAMLGNLSNAEEKEAEAMIKLQQALEILRGADPEFVPAEPQVPAQVPGTTNLAGVDSALNALNAAKAASYAKLYEANELEAKRLETETSGIVPTIRSDASLDAEYNSGLKNIADARQTQRGVPQVNDAAVKVELLVQALAKQSEGIRQLNSVRAAAKVIAAGKITEEGEEIVQAEPPTATVTASPQNTVAPEPEPTIAASEPTTAATNVVAENTITPSAVVSQLKENAALNNPQANEMVRKAIQRLGELELESARSESGNETLPSNLTPAEMRLKADEALTSSETSAAQAFAKRREAERSSGAEKDQLLTEAAQLESRSQGLSLEAAELVSRANAPEITRNSNAITELFEDLKADKPADADNLEEERSQMQTLQTQAATLRREAEQMSSNGAKIGAMGNAEEKENELLQKQTTLLNKLRTFYPDYELPALPETAAPATGVATNAPNKETIQAAQFNELTTLTNGFSLEFESLKKRVPASLNASEQSRLDSALLLNADAKMLVIRSASEKDPSIKMSLLSSAALKGNAAVARLNTIAGAATADVPKDAAALDEIGRQIAAANDNNNPAPPEATRAATTAAPVRRGNTIRIEGLEVIRGDAYSATKPIPVDAKIENGLVFRVQIGAFRTRIPDNAFKGLSPLNAETTNSGYLRYTAGNFVKIENANAVKNDLRGLGYTDAFVVAYFNGKRISLAEALLMMKNEGRVPDPNAPQTAGITANVNVPQAINNTAIQEPVVVEKELERTNGLLYTIQIGVYNKQVSRQRLFNLLPVYTEQLANGLYRYTAGIYSNTERLVSDKKRVADIGIRDAFVAAYINGKRVPFSEARQRQATDASIFTEAEKPIIFPAGAAPLPGAAATAAPATNKAYPPATAENGVKATEEGICFKVQLGAYSREVPPDVAAKFSGIRNWPVETKQINNLVIYNIGNFSAARFAKQLKEEASKLGISDAFITVYRDGKKLYGQEASELLSR